MILIASLILGVLAGLAFYGAWAWVEASYDRVTNKHVGSGPATGGNWIGRRG